jgi:hypothetical protein
MFFLKLSRFKDNEENFEEKTRLPIGTEIPKFYQIRCHSLVEITKKLVKYN